MGGRAHAAIRIFRPTSVEREISRQSMGKKIFNFGLSNLLDKKELHKGSGGRAKERSSCSKTSRAGTINLKLLAMAKKGKRLPRHNPDSPRRPNSLFALVPRARLE